MTQPSKTIGNHIYIAINQPERKDHITIGGKELYLDTKFDAEFKVAQTGYVVMTNKNFENIGVSIGTKVWFHHFVVGEVTKRDYQSNGVMVDDKRLYKVDAEELFAYEIEGVVHPVFNRLFCEPMTRKNPLYKNSVLELPKHIAEEDVQGLARVLYVSENVAKNDIYPGDVILYSLHSDYKMNLNGEDVYCMNLEDVMGIADDYAIENIQVE
jgi:hypothetical protein